MPKEPSGAHQAARDLLRRYREAAGLSQESLTEQAGLSPRGLVYLERGRHRPYPATPRRLADALSLTAGEREALALAGMPPPPCRPPRSTLPNFRSIAGTGRRRRRGGTGRPWHALVLHGARRT